MRHGRSVSPPPAASSGTSSGCSICPSCRGPRPAALKYSSTLHARTPSQLELERRATLGPVTSFRVNIRGPADHQPLLKLADNAVAERERSHRSVHQEAAVVDHRPRQHRPSTNPQLDTEINSRNVPGSAAPLWQGLIEACQALSATTAGSEPRGGRQSSKPRRRAASVSSRSKRCRPWCNRDAAVLGEMPRTSAISAGEKSSTSARYTTIANSRGSCRSVALTSRSGSRSRACALSVWGTGNLGCCSPRNRQLARPVEKSELGGHCRSPQAPSAVSARIRSSQTLRLVLSANDPNASKAEDTSAEPGCLCRRGHMSSASRLRTTGRGTAWSRARTVRAR